MGILSKLVDAISPTPTEKPAAPPADSPGSWLMLAPGKHVVDGVTVEIPPSAQPLVAFAVKPGKHIVDDKIAIAPLIYASR